MLAPLILFAGWLASPVRAATAAATTAQVEARLDQLADAERVRTGLPALAAAGDLTEVCRRHATRMTASGGSPYHNSGAGSEVGGWEMLAENVGHGWSAEQIHEAFMASSAHRSNILRARYSQTGVGAVYASDGSLYVCVLYRDPAEPAAPLPAAAAPAPAPAAATPPPPPPAPAPTTAAPAPTTTAQPPTTTTVVATTVAPTTTAAAARVELASMTPAVSANVLPEPVARTIPAAAWAAALALPLVVGAQAGAVRRLGLA